MGSEPSAGRRYSTLVAVCLTVIVLMFNVTAPIVALADIAGGIDAGFASLQWVLSAYALCLAAFQIGAGRIADIKGRRLTFLVSTGLFVVSSLVCSLAVSAEMLIIGRTAQGAAAAALTASSLALLATEFTGRARSRAIGIWGGALAVSFALGPVVGGLAVDIFSWRAIFALGIPISLAAFLIVWHEVSESKDRSVGPVDLSGMLLLAGSLLLAMLAVLSVNSNGLVSPVVLVPASGSLIGLALFLWIERGRSNPVLDPAWFSNRTFLGAALIVGLMSASNFGAFVYISYFLVVVLNENSLEVGLVLASAAFTTALVSLVSGFRLDRVPMKLRFACGQALLAAGLLSMSMVEATTATRLIPSLALCGAGVGLTNPLSAQAHLAVMPSTMAGLASGVNNTARQLGVAFGTACMGVLVEFRARRALESSGVVLDLPEPIRAAVVDGLLGPSQTPATELVEGGVGGSLHRALEASYLAGLDSGLMLAAILAAIGIVIALLMVRESDFLDSRA